MNAESGILDAIRVAEFLKKATHIYYGGDQKAACEMVDRLYAALDRMDHHHSVVGQLSPEPLRHAG